MQKIVELNLNELQAVAGGHKTVAATATTTMAVPSQSASALAVSYNVKPGFTMPDSLTAAVRRY